MSPAGFRLYFWLAGVPFRISVVSVKRSFLIATRYRDVPFANLEKKLKIGRNFFDGKSEKLALIFTAVGDREVVGVHLTCNGRWKVRQFQLSGIVMTKTTHLAEKGKMKWSLRRMQVSVTLSSTIGEQFEILWIAEERVSLNKTRTSKVGAISKAQKA